MKNNKCALCGNITLTADENGNGISIFCTSYGKRVCIDCASAIHGLFENPNHSGLPRYNKKTIPADIRWSVFIRDNYQCKKCGSKINLHCDHIHPESKGGKTEISNLQTLCGKCNKSKGIRIN